MLKHNKAFLKNFIKEFKPSKSKDNTAFVYVIYDHNYNSGIDEGFLYVATPWKAVKILLKDNEAVNMIQEGFKIPFTKAEDMLMSKGKILSGYYKRFRDGQGGFQEVKAEVLPDIKVIKDFFLHEEAYIELKDTRLIQVDNQQEYLRIFTSIEEGKPEAVKHYIKNNIFEGVDMRCFHLYGKKESATHRPMVLTSGEFYDNSSPIYIITPVRYKE